jgi:hypothetical protein
MNIEIVGSAKSIHFKCFGSVINCAFNIKAHVFPEYVKMYIVYDLDDVTQLFGIDLRHGHFQDNEIWARISQTFKHTNICEKELLDAIGMLRGFTF